MPEFGSLAFDLIRMRESKTNKYDLLCKDLISLRRSTLSRLLAVDGYGVERIEFRELFGERSDAVYRKADHIVHVEFQTKNDADLPWRMLEYYTRIVGTHGDRAAPDDLVVDQQILYIGTPAAAPRTEVRTKNLLFRFRWKDVRDFSGEADALLASRFPDDWILGVLCMPRVELQTWQRVARRFARIGGSYDAVNLLKAKFLLAAHARQMSEDEIRGLMQMAAIFNVEDSAALRDLADGILSDGGARAFLELIGDLMSDESVVVAEDDRAELSSFDVTQLHRFLRTFYSTKSVEDSMASARASAPEP